ncbi:MAG: hypothetical protein AAB509_00940 [Patescibacteria group bacterium]
MNTTKEKILLLLLGGLAFGCSYTPGKQWKVLKTVSMEWKRLNKKELREGISDLHRSKFINKNKDLGDLIGITLTKKGKLKALNIQLDGIKNKKEKWDKKWRMVAFDIPEKFKRGRDALRHKLKKIGFCELQKSIFITPYDCEKEIGLLIEFFELDKYVRFGILEFIDNENYFKQFFKIT